MSANTLPINAEARGKLRVWRQKAEAARLRLHRALISPDTQDAAVDFARKRGQGQRRAFAKLQKAFAGATLEHLRLEAPAFALWAYLKSRVAVTLNPQDPSSAQDCVTVDYIIAGALSDEFDGVSDGLWTLEVKITRSAGCCNGTPMPTFRRCCLRRTMRCCGRRCSM